VDEVELVLEQIDLVLDAPAFLQIGSQKPYGYFHQNEKPSDADADDADDDNRGDHLLLV
jgi:hypothetical protein